MHSVGDIFSVPDSDGQYKYNSIYLYFVQSRNTNITRMNTLQIPRYASWMLVWGNRGEPSPHGIRWTVQMPVTKNSWSSVQDDFIITIISNLQITEIQNSSNY